MAANDEPRWMLLFDARQRMEIEFNVLYHNRFRHGTNGHNERLIVAKMAGLVELLVAEVPGVSSKVEELIRADRTDEYLQNRG